MEMDCSHRGIFSDLDDVIKDGMIGRNTTALCIRNDNASAACRDDVDVIVDRDEDNVNMELLTLIFDVVLGVVLVTCCVMTVAGNVVVLHAVRTDRKLQTVCNMFIVSLATSDLIVGLFVMPMSTVYVFTVEWRFGVELCQLWIAIDYTASTASILNLFVLSLDRYWSVTTPLKYLRKRTKRRALVMISLVWTVSLLWVVPIVGWHHFVNNGVRVVPADVCDTEYATNTTLKIITSILNFYLPLAAMYALYTKIFVEIRHRSLLEVTTSCLSSTATVTVRRPGLTVSVDGSVIDSEEQTPLQSPDNVGKKMLTTFSQRVSLLRSPSRRSYNRPEVPVNPSSCDPIRPEKEGGSIMPMNGTTESILSCYSSRSDHQNGVLPGTPHIDEIECRVTFSLEPASADSDIANATRPRDLPKEPHPAKDQTVKLTACTNAAAAGFLSSIMQSGNNDNDDGTNSWRRTFSFNDAFSRHLENSSARTNAGGYGRQRGTSLRQNRHHVNRHGHTPTTSLQRRHRQQQLQQQQQLQHITPKSQSHRPSSALRKEIKAAKQLGVIMGAFTICFLPYFVCFTVVAFCAECIDVRLMTAVTWIGYLNSTLNPFLYPLCNANFRNKFRQMLRCGGGRRHLPSNRQRGSSRAGPRNTMCSCSDRDRHPVMTSSALSLY